MSDENTTPENVVDETPHTVDAGGMDGGHTMAEPSPSSTASDGTDTTDASAQPHYGVGPFSLREVVLLGVWLVAFIVSFFSVWVDGPITGGALPFGSVWSSGIDWILTIGVPTVAVFLIVLRRFSPDGIRRVGSLAVDQFASVAFSVSAVVWLGILWTNISRAVQTGLWLSSWVVWVEFFLMMAGVFLTVLAPFIQPFDQDFRHRPEVPAHRNARPARLVSARPVSARPTFGEETTPTATYAEPSAFAPVEEAEAEPAAAASQAFWALAPEEREVVDDNGLPIFTIGPTAWALVIEDRGSSFVVRHEDGRVGYLTDTSGVTRG